MRREDSSTVLTVIFSLLISLCITTEVEARTLVQVCSSSCGDIQNISYPFRLKGDPAGCGDPDYELSCENNKTIFEFHRGNYYVRQISYEKQTIRVVDVNLASGSCGLPNRSLSLSEVNGDSRYRGFVYNIYTNFVNCSTVISDPSYRQVPCLSANTSHVYVIYDDYRASGFHDSCVFISMVPTVHVSGKYPSYGAIQKLLETGFDLGWSVECRDCLESGDSCVITKWEIPLQYECDRPGQILSTLLSTLDSTLESFILDLILIGRFIFAPLVIFVFLIHKYQTTRVDTAEKFLGNGQSSMPKRYSYADIMAMTNHFNDLIGQGGLGSVYKGELPGCCLVAVKMLGNKKFSEEEFIDKVTTIGSIHHANVVQLVGFCSEGSKWALVYEYMPNGSLEKHTFLKEGNGPSFSWEKLHEIALGMARGIEYLHRGCDVCVLHFDIKPHNILLDHGFIPKISDFGLAKFYPKKYDFVSISTTRGTIGYIAPELISRNFEAVSCKSDVYSFGMLLLEMAGARKNEDAKASSSSKVYFPSWVYDHLQEGADLELVNVTKIQVNIARKLCIVGLWCMQMKPSDRPTMTKVVEMLEGNIDDLEMPPRPREPQLDSSTELLVSESMEEIKLVT